MRLDLLNGLGFALALGLSMAGAGGGGGEARRVALPRALAPGAALTPETLPGGERVLRDASGTPVPLARYRRIASGTLVADRVLSDLCEPDRIVAFTRHGAATPSGHRYQGKPAISGRDAIERILALKPDLLLVSDLVDAQYVARLREHGVRVFDLGPMRGLETLLPNILALGHLIGAPERAARYAATLRKRMAAVAGVAGGPRRPRTLYIGIYGDRLFGAGAHTSYHDVIEHAGLRDAAAERGLSGWPELTGESVLAIAPEVILTRTGMAAVLCRHPGLEHAGPCRGDGRIVELEGALLDDPGPGLLEATEALHAAFWAP